jgi:hypothetical protein
MASTVFLNKIIEFERTYGFVASTGEAGKCDHRDNNIIRISIAFGYYLQLFNVIRDPKGIMGILLYS